MARVRRSDRGQSRRGAGQGVPQSRCPRPRTASRGTPRPAPRKAASCHRCWPTSPCPSSTITSPRPGSTTWPPLATGTSPSPRSATYRLVRYADDFVVMVAATEAHAEALREEVAAVLATDGPAPVGEKTMIVHIDEGFDFLGCRIQRHTKRARPSSYVYTYPRKKAFASIKAKVKTITDRERTSRSPPPAPAQRGAAGLDQLLPARRVQGDVRLRAPVHLAAGGRMASPQASPGQLEVAAPALPAEGGGRPTGAWRCSTPSVPVTRYRYRGSSDPDAMGEHGLTIGDPARARGEPDAVELARPVRGAARGNGPAEMPAPRPGPTPHLASDPAVPAGGLGSGAEQPRSALGRGRRRYRPRDLRPW